ncbi:hypothetical protein SAMN04488061_1073 [Filomicrobium insigne]|uniref:Uncharacterized protein n=1 Tax=Filomicrobium insigne TaxID=418854 RepID=A0A1H0J6S1_9HYPH|nr:hypothetical protein [Filomicrobium insigne]SDO39354.1 hypothetical protein SAMN04488061_1073 [Filomicrobium insigne]
MLASLLSGIVRPGGDTVKKKPAAIPPRQPPRVPVSPSDTRSAPDPFSIVLPAIAALGAVSSIASINWAAQDKTPDRSKPKRKAGTALRDLETCCLGLTEIFRRFQKHPKLFCGEGASPNSPLKFGVHSARVSPDSARVFQQIVNDVASMLVLASQNAFDVMSAVEDGEINAPEELFFGFGECQQKLNELIQSRATLKTTVEVGLEVSERLTSLVRDMKTYRLE